MLFFAHLWERFIAFYFEIGLKFKDITSVLGSRHVFLITERHLKRLLNARGLFRPKAYSDLAVHGYRWMYTECNLMIVGLV